MLWLVSFILLTMILSTGMTTQTRHLPNPYEAWRFDASMSMTTHVNRLISTCFYQMQRMCAIRRSIPTPMVIQLINTIKSVCCLMMYKALHESALTYISDFCTTSVLTTVCQIVHHFASRCERQQTHRSEIDKVLSVFILRGGSFCLELFIGPHYIIAIN